MQLSTLRYRPSKLASCLACTVRQTRRLWILDFVWQCESDRTGAGQAHRNLEERDGSKELQSAHTGCDFTMTVTRQKPKPRASPLCFCTRRRCRPQRWSSSWSCAARTETPEAGAFAYAQKHEVDGSLLAVPHCLCCSGTIGDVCRRYCEILQVSSQHLLQGKGSAENRDLGKPSARSCSEVFILSLKLVFVA